MQGVIEVDVNLETKEAVVEFEEPKTDLKKIKAVVREAGFEAEEGQSGEQVP